MITVLPSEGISVASALILRINCVSTVNCFCAEETVLLRADAERNSVPSILVLKETVALPSLLVMGALLSNGLPSADDSEIVSPAIGWLDESSSVNSIGTDFSRAEESWTSNTNVVPTTGKIKVSEIASTDAVTITSTRAGELIVN